MSISANPTAKQDHQDKISLPLYISGLAVTWAGVSAVNSQISSDMFSTTTVALVLLGFVFSLAARWAHIDKRIINGIPLVIAGYLGIRYLQHDFDLAAMAPVEAQQSGDMAIAVALAWVSIIRSWMMVTDTAVVFSCVTSIAMIGLVGAFNVNTDLIIDFFVYVIAALYLVIHQNYLVHQTWLGGARTVRNDLDVLRTHVILCVVLGVTALLIGTVLLVPVKMIGSKLSLAEAVRFYYNPVGIDPGKNVEYSDDPKFSVGGGDGYTASDSIVMVAIPSDRSAHYWRGRSYDLYTRHGWTSTLTEPLLTLEPEPIVRDGQTYAGYLVHRNSDVEGPEPGPRVEQTLYTRFDMVGGRTTTLYTPSDPQTVVTGRPLEFDLKESPDGGIGFDQVQDRMEYVVISNDVDPSLHELRAARRADCPTGIVTRYVDDRGQDILSASEQERLQETANYVIGNVPPKERDMFEEAMALQQWVGHRCLYDLNVGPVPSDQDAVSYFLFDSRRGYCDLFASSLALMCRYANIPARVVTGFAPGTPNNKGGYDIRAKDKHAWVEVFLPGVGWYPLDATIDATPADSLKNNFDFAAIFRAIVAKLSLLMALNGPIPIILFAVIVISLAYVLKVEVVDRLRVRLRRRSRVEALRGELAGSQLDPAVIEAARQLTEDRYARMENALRTIGIVRGRNVTPLVFQALVESTLNEKPPTGLAMPVGTLIGAVDTLTRDIVVACYAPVNDAAGLIEPARREAADTALAVMEHLGRQYWFASFKQRFLKPKLRPT